MKLNLKRAKEGILKIDKRWVVFIVISLILSSGIIAYNADDIYALNKSRLSAVLPSDYNGGEKVSFPVLVSSIDGEPKENKEVKVSLKRGGEKELLYQGKTGDQGLNSAEFELPEGDYEGKLIVESEGKRVEKSIRSWGRTRLFVSTDKPIYQPGQTVHIRSLCFQGDRPLDENRTVNYTIKTPEGDKIFKKSFTPNEFGISYYNYSLSKILPLGAYELKVDVGEKSSKISFLVDEYVLPRFDINFRSLEDWYLYGEYMSGTLDADYFFGKDIQGEADVDLLFDGEEIDSYTGVLNEGQMPFYFELPEYQYGYDSNDHITLNATITDTSGHTEWDMMDIPIAEEPLNFNFISPKNVDGVRSDYTVKVSFPDGTPVAGLGIEGELGSNNLGYRTTSSAGLVTWTTTYEGEYYFYVETEYDGESYREQFPVDGGSGIKVLSMPGGDKVGQNKEFLIYYRGSSLSDRIYYNVQTEKNVLYSDYFIMDEEPHSLQIPVVYEMVPEYRLNVYAIESDLSYSSDSVQIDVDQQGYMDLSISTNKRSYLPGEEIGIGFHTERKGSPVRSAIEVKITDESIYELNQLKGLEEIFTKEGGEVEESVGFEVLSAGGSLQEADRMKDNWVGRFWSAIIFLIITGILGVVVLGWSSGGSGKNNSSGTKIKGKSKVIVATVVMVAITIVLASTLYMMLPKGSDSGTTAPDDMDEGDPGAGRQEEAADAPFAGDKSNLFDGQDSESTQSDGQSEEETKGGGMRTDFPETWYWNPSLITDSNGDASLSLITPDSITSWMIDGVASTKDGEMVGESANITVFKDFFIEPDIPVSSVRNDRFEFRVMVYNYMDHSVNANIVLEGADWYTLHDSRQKDIYIDSQEVSNVTYDITVDEVGDHEVSLIATGGGEYDAIRKLMRVVPDGEKNVQVFNGQMTDNDHFSASFSENEDVIPVSKTAFVKLYGGMDSVTLDSAEGFIHKVRGCGEQSLSTLSIDVLAYGIAVESEDPPENMEEYERIVVQGIQHEMQYLKEAKNGKGRGIVWFTDDQDVHPWLTSWGLMTFKDAKDEGLAVDDKVITDMQDWLVTQQNSDGSWEFPEWGLYETTSQELKDKKVATTAYITRSLIYSGFDASSSAVKKGLSYIDKNIKDHWDDPYILSLSALTLKMAGETDSRYESMLSQINSLRIEENNSVYWQSKSSMLQDSDNYYYGSTGSKAIETTGYALMALVGEGYGSTTDKAVKYLLENRNEFGTFYTTQDTVVALQAIKKSGEIYMDEMEISVTLNGQHLQQFNFTEENRDQTYVYEFTEYLESSNKIELTSSGQGRVSFQIVYEEYIEWVSSTNIEDIYFDVRIPAQGTVGEEYEMSIELSYEEDAPYSKMGIVIIPLPTGFRTVDYEYLMEGEHISNYEIENGELRIYLTDLRNGTSVEFDVVFIPSKEGNFRVQGIHYYDMYATEIDIGAWPKRVDIGEKTI